MILHVSFAQESTALDVRFSDDSTFPCTFGQLSGSAGEHDHYIGAYDVVPAREKTVLETKDLIMDDDVLVTAIPYYQVSNLSGGKTVYIGGPGEIDITRRKTNGKQ